MTISSEWPSESLGVGNVLDPVGELFQVAVRKREGDAVGVLGLLLDVVDVGVQRLEAPDHLVLVPVEAVGELEVARRVRVGQLVAHDELVVVRPVEREPGRVGPRCFIDWSIRVMSRPISWVPSDR